MNISFKLYIISFNLVPKYLCKLELPVTFNKLFKINKYF